MVPFGVVRILLGGSKTIAAPDAEIVGLLVLALLPVHTRSIMFCVADDLGLCVVPSGKVVQVPSAQFAIEETLSFPR